MPPGTGGFARSGGLERGAPIARNPIKRTAMKRRPADNHLTADQWAAIFRLLLVRSEGRCEGGTPWCAAPGGVVAGMPRDRVSIQHRLARGKGGTALPEGAILANFLILCGTGTTGCHGWVETKERAQAKDRGLWVRHTYDEHGNPVPVETFPVELADGRRVLLHPTEPRYLPIN